jgi:hypothetical protein
MIVGGLRGMMIWRRKEGPLSLAFVAPLQDADCAARRSGVLFAGFDGKHGEEEMVDESSGIDQV